MSPEKQRIAIAEACPSAVKKTVTVITGHGFDEEEIALDPLRDLNAMHEAEKVLTEDKTDLRGTDQRCRFITHLGEIVGCWKSGHEHNSLFQLAHATAAQRAEAFLRTLGKWEES